ncbi:aminotransferase class I/II-fold pyridoxal phosphate-dependent enzyme [Nitratireductor mangrovi]|uniref:aspartate transaminase n=1 Tax=Nitratireductor mangrovi TaxID=2599600 RepID=A0A5B8KYM3_9HYPH|nr:aminotransferase class I/II-fold pyridoxal phosphate-dependent enzyme [Nitratireductor mangrovi]QDZ00817.1 aminotransferase class I/II-fold pyridoxal phosphate-dependent enzyme [Nitratireductor mangrovi]
MTVAISRRSAVEPFHAMDVLADANRLKAKGFPIISMAVGQPSEPAPKAVRDAAVAAAINGRIGYTDALGISELREAISNHYADHYDVDVPYSRIVVTTGSSAAFNLAFLAMFDPRDRVATTAPGYPAYRNIMKALGIELIEIPLAKGGYPTAELMADAFRDRPFKGFLFASPANPTGSVIPADEIARIAMTAKELGISLISDEIYHRLAFDAADTTALAADPDVVVINSFSKYYCMTGWRIGWMVVPDALLRPIERIQQSLYISAPELSQRAAVHAFGAGVELDAVKRKYAMSREMLLKQLPRLGLEIAAPMDGAFYAYCDVSRFSNDSMAFARRMIREAHVAATPGHDFDPVNGHRTMRFSYAGDPADMIEAMDRLETWLAK